MPLVSIISGRYNLTYPIQGGDSSYTAVDMGVTDDTGYYLSWTPHAHLINKTDTYQKTLIDAIHQGADFKIRFRCMEFAKIPALSSPMGMVWPWGTTSPGAFMALKLGKVGRRYSDNARALVLSGTVGTPARPAVASINSTPNTLTANLAIFSPAMSTGYHLTSKMRDIAVEMVLLPTTDGSNTIWYSTT